MIEKSSGVNIAVGYALPRAGLPAATSFRKWACAALQDRAIRAELAIRLVDAHEGHALNRFFRGKDRATNVLSFPAELPEGLPEKIKSPVLGDLVLCAPVIAHEAKVQGKPLNFHYAHLTVHGVLHLLGWNHTNDGDAEYMERIEREILAGLNIPNPY